MRNVLLIALLFSLMLPVTVEHGKAVSVIPYRITPSKPPITTQTTVPLRFADTDVTLQSAKVSFFKEASSGPVVPGDRIDYTLTVLLLQATSPVTITVTDPLPTGVTLVPDSATVNQGQLKKTNPIVWEWKAPALLLPIPQQGVLKFSVEVTSTVEGGSTISNKATVELCQQQVCKEGKVTVGTKASQRNNPPRIEFVRARPSHQLSPQRAVTIDVGDELVLDVRASDPDVGGETPDIVTLTVQRAPSNSSFRTAPDETNRTVRGNPAKGVFCFTPNESQAGQTFELIFEARDLAGATDSKTVTINVKQTKKPLIEVDPPEIDFGSVGLFLAKDGRFEQKSFTIKNVGDANLEVTGIRLQTFVSPFSLCSPVPLPQTLAPGDSVPVPVCFAPNSVGPIHNIVHIDNNDRPAQVALAGVGQGDSKIHCRGLPEILDARVVSGTLTTKITIETQITPPHTADYVITVTDPDGGKDQFSDKTAANGNGKFSLKGRFGLFGPGVWTIQVEWEGDPDHFPASGECDFEVKTLITDTETGRKPALCNDIVLRAFDAQPVQAVWQDDGDYGPNDMVQINPVVWKINAPLVKAKNTYLFGLAPHRDEIRLLIDNYFNQPRQVKLEIKLIEAEKQRVLDRHLIDQVYKLPPSTCAEDGSPGRVLVKLPTPLGGFNNEPFDLNADGNIRFVVEVVDVDGLPIQDAIPTNQAGQLLASTQSTQCITVTFKPLVFVDDLSFRGERFFKEFTKLGIPTKNNELAPAGWWQNAFDLIQGSFPLKEKGLTFLFDPVPIPMVLPKPSHVIAPILMSLIDNPSVSNIEEWKALFNKERELLMQAFFLSNQIAYFFSSSTPSKCIHRLGLLTQPEFLGAMGLRGATSLSLPSVFLLDWDALGNTVAHELAHTLGVRTKAEEYDGAPIHLIKGTGFQGNFANGYWVNRRENKDENACFMSSGLNQTGISWVDKDDYRQLFTSLKGGVDPALIVIRGLAGEDGTIILAPWYRTTGFPDVTIDSEGAYSVVLLDKDAHELNRYRFDLVFSFNGDDLGIVPSDYVPFAFAVPDRMDVAKVEIRNNEGQVLAQRFISTSVPQVSITSPDGGELIKLADSLSIEWEASDADGDTLSYLIFYSTNNGQTWNLLASDIGKTHFEFPAKFLPVGHQTLVKVVATDGVNTATDQSSAPFVINDSG